MEETKETPASGTTPPALEEAFKSIRRCDERLIEAGKLALGSARYFEGIEQVILAAQELAHGVSIYRSAAVASGSGDPPPTEMTVGRPENLLGRVLGGNGLYDVAREAAYIELAADEKRRGEIARREFALDPVRWSRGHGSYAGSLAMAFKRWEDLPAAGISGGYSTSTPSDALPADPSTFKEMWIAVNNLSREFTETLQGAPTAPAPARARTVTVDWLSPPPI